MLGTHPIWIALLEGVGWSRETGTHGPPNRWGLRPYDSWVATHLAERYGLEPVDVGSAESERRSRMRYLELWREDPVTCWPSMRAGCRMPSRRIRRGRAGTALLLLTPIASALLWRDRNVALLTVLLSAAMMWACIAFQTVALDPRLLYSYPLHAVSAIALSLAASGAIWSLLRIQTRHPLEE